MSTDERRIRFESLYDRHLPAVLGYALRRMPADAVEDLVGETFLVAWRRLDDVPDDAVPWLLAVAHKQLANQRRATRRRLALAERLAHERQPASRDPIDDLDPRVETALAGLSDTEREALLLVAWDGLDRGQAAAVVGCSRATFRVRLHRARRHVQDALATSRNGAIS